MSVWYAAQRRRRVALPHHHGYIGRNFVGAAATWPWALLSAQNYGACLLRQERKTKRRYASRPLPSWDVLWCWTLIGNRDKDSRRSENSGNGDKWDWQSLCGVSFSPTFSSSSLTPASQSRRTAEGIRGKRYESAGNGTFHGVRTTSVGAWTWVFILRLVEWTKQETFSTSNANPSGTVCWGKVGGGSADISKATQARKL